MKNSGCHGNSEKTLKIFLSQTVTSSSGIIPKYLKLWPWSGNYSYVVGFLISRRDKEGNFLKNLIVPNHKGYIFHIWHVASSSGPLPKYFRYIPGVEISPMLWGLGFHIEIKWEILKNLLVPNRKG